MKNNQEGTITLNAYNSWIACGACGKRVTADSIHTCSPQLKELTDEEIKQIYKETHFSETIGDCDYMEFARAILRKAQEK